MALMAILIAWKYFNDFYEKLHWRDLQCVCVIGTFIDHEGNTGKTVRP